MNQDDVVVVIETDKVAVDVRSTHAGFLESQLAEQGEGRAECKAGGCSPCDGCWHGAASRDGCCGGVGGYGADQYHPLLPLDLTPQALP